MLHLDFPRISASLFLRADCWDAGQILLVSGIDMSNVKKKKEKDIKLTSW